MQQVERWLGWRSEKQEGGGGKQRLRSLDTLRWGVEIQQARFFYRLEGKIQYFGSGFFLFFRGGSVIVRLGVGP